MGQYGRTGRLERRATKEIEDYLTPYKLRRPVLAPSGEKGAFDCLGVDNMRICRHNGKFYMFYIRYDGTSYRTALAVSDDLINWEKKGVVLDAGSGRAWDNSGRVISCLVADIDLYGSRELIKKDGKYWMYYHAYPGRGYENGVAENGLAWTTDENLMEWYCEEKPVFSKGVKGQWDGDGMYSVWFLEHAGKSWLFYNGKKFLPGSWTEQVGVAFSDGLRNFKRYEGNPILKVTPEHWDNRFSCGQHVLYDSHRKQWVMFYCGFDWKHAQEGVAISDDLLNWRKYEHPIIKVGEKGSLDSLHAHKPCMIYHDGALYHFYCSVRPTVTPEEKAKYGHEYRCITVARSKPW
ncbi:MAG: hypothetical protein Q4C70_03305 [Planctomycetia bacterium]|nr:hypothetical protein [Planctomycetia bacterium]